MNSSSPTTMAQLSFDATDKYALTQFWSQLLEWDVDLVGGEVAVHSGGADTDKVVLFMDVPEEKGARIDVIQTFKPKIWMRLWIGPKV